MTRHEVKNLGPWYMLQLWRGIVSFWIYFERKDNKFAKELDKSFKERKIQL
jgi:hypothetical protein